MQGGVADTDGNRQCVLLWGSGPGGIPPPRAPVIADVLYKKAECGCRACLASGSLLLLQGRGPGCSGTIAQ
jgi:hypothetical protein